MKKLRFSFRDFWKKYQKDQVSTVASSLAFTSVLSLVPMMALAYFFLDFSGGLDTLQHDLEDFIFSNLAPSFGNQMSGYVASIRKNISPGALGVFGVVGSVYTSISMLAKMEHALNAIWEVEKSRPWSQKITQYWTMMTLGPLLLATSFVLSGRMIAWVKKDNGEIAKLVLFAWTFVPYLASCLLFAGIYFTLPNRRVSKRGALLSGVLTALVFEISKQGYGFYASHAIGKSVYGSLGVLPVFLLWLYWAWVILLVGAELCYFLEHRYFASMIAQNKELPNERTSKK